IMNQMIVASDSVLSQWSQCTSGDGGNGGGGSGGNGGGWSGGNGGGWSGGNGGGWSGGNGGGSGKKYTCL
ncbi:hypothetical protein AVEN_24914-1, partial [Araneus ventricosus]